MMISQPLQWRLNMSAQKENLTGKCGRKMFPGLLRSYSLTKAMKLTHLVSKTEDRVFVSTFWVLMQYRDSRGRRSMEVQGADDSRK